MSERLPDPFTESGALGLALSALLDEELRGAELDAALEAMAAQPDSALQCWSDYHALRDGLRHSGVGMGRSDAQFLQRLHTAAGLPPLVDQPENATLSIAPCAGLTGVGAVWDGQKGVANQPLGGWRWLASAASLAALALLAWQALPGRDEHAAIPQWADTSLGVMQRDPQLDALLAAHGEVASGLPSPAAQVRHAALVEVAR